MTSSYNDLPPLRKWLIETKKLTKVKDYTHLLLDGGKLKITKDCERQFLIKYAEDVFKGYKHYICEIKTPVFKLFSDLDFFEDYELTTEELVKYCGHIQGVISEFFNTHSKWANEETEETVLDKRVIVCTTDTKKCQIDGAEYTKTGAHLIWPNIYISKKTALLLRKCIVQSIEMKYGSRPSYNSWEDVVDQTVYEQNGLRMIGSHKMSNCSVCKRNKKKMCSKENCIEMFNCRKIDEGRPYSPSFVLDEYGKLLPQELSKLKNDTFYTVVQTSIRTDTLVETKHSSPVWFTFTQEKPKSKVKVIPGIEDKLGIKELKPKQRVSDTDTRTNKVQEFIKKYLPSPYKRVNVTDLFLCENNTYVAQTDSRFCMNIDREHNSNHIYFCINKNEIYQKCFCRCTSKEGRKFSLCSEYKSAGRKISATLQKLLFPQLSTKTLTSQDYSQFITFQSEDEQLGNILNSLEDQLFGKRNYENDKYS